ncbi:hypothetical protein BN7_1412 [Wickerhamomyces ciferrii]|uniref:CBM21 domain-containing protein n=1 Tax=Wickerhamomyces ciferrii (strain ATCC 14091 / BCRC 22168 / CBS 111 / JCM 3599 / NBRC 0793 / NRRL Y-1031 F-60-10) TaxID=1206466 RepID=K0KL94_WICCF|nr:uncharacterized protein BN7_1412 [Wickerhamomyces ciferrii]CCH41873.1 hypothetical protein BN7_1412 [Wickerhamomyces ciferrii]
MSDQRKNSTSSVINLNNKNSLSLSFLHKKRHSDSSINNENDQEGDNGSLHKTNSTSSIPKLVRKKSGELVKSNLKLNCLMNGEYVSKSMPTTPLYKKGVHFGQDVDVRYFNEKDKPTAVSANTSPILKGRSYKFHHGHGRGRQKDVFNNNFGKEYGYGNLNNYDYQYDSIESDDDSIGYNSDEEDDDYLLNWDLDLINFEKIKYNEKIHIEKSSIFLERISIDEENDCILGVIAVKNLSFEKKIHIRYTFDHWKTVIEIESFYIENESIPKVLKRSNYDRFKFKIPLINFKFMSESKIKVFFCIRYRYKQINLNEVEIWDNNNYKNYEIELTKHKKKRFTKNHKFSLDDYSNKTNNNNTMNNINDSYFHNYEINVKSPETPKVLKINDDDDIPPLINTDLNLKNMNLVDEDYFSLNHSNHQILPTTNLKNDEIDPFNNENNENNDHNNNINTNNNTTKTSSIAQNFKLNRNHKPMINSKSYQELLDSYCFFKSDNDQNNLKTNTISSYLDQNLNKH